MCNVSILGPIEWYYQTTKTGMTENSLSLQAASKCISMATIFVHMALQFWSILSVQRVHLLYPPGNDRIILDFCRTERYFIFTVIIIIHPLLYKSPETSQSTKSSIPAYLDTHQNVEPPTCKCLALWTSVYIAENFLGRKICQAQLPLKHFVAPMCHIIYVTQEKSRIKF